MVDDHHGTASMTVDATTQAVTRRYTKPFGEPRGTTPTAWPDDKGFLGKPADVDTGLTHIGAREYDPAAGRFLSVDPVLAPDDHESLNGYAYANNTPVTKSDPTGLKPVTDCERGCNDGKGGRYHDYMTPGPNGTWVYHSTQTYTQTFQYEKPGGGTGSGSMTVTIRNDGGVKSAQIVFKKGPDPKPEARDGSQCRSCYMMGTNPYYDPNADDLPDTPKLKTWQKVVLGVVTGVAVAVAAAPVAVALGDGCLATAPVCAAEIAEMVTGGASGGSLTIGGAAVGGSLKFVNAAEEIAPKIWINCGACAIATDSTLSGTPMRAWDSGFLASEVLEQYFGGTFKYQENGAAGITTELLKAGNGARGVIFAWQEGSDVGHFFNAVNHGGNVKFLDGQAGGYADMDWDHWELMHTGGGVPAP
ncbi:RHS repeat-associated protein [Streptomyces canus]|uniref:RHS repeat-associated protein n=1 Tax=Streptomyces canus TaxID=58343 RepID=A0AAW8F1X3_9ACTN|nr:RHS repeat-associated core domain-containing protein [Streptomyces canus]MDQ0904036.1 RHS repeat-associated protein [Streptomyces canus]